MADSSHYFYAHDGQVLKNIGDLFEFLSKTDEGTFEHHFNDQRNDFANWVGDSLKLKKLSEKMYAAKTRGELYDVVKEEIDRTFEELADKIDKTSE